MWNWFIDNFVSIIPFVITALLTFAYYKVYQFQIRDKYKKIFRKNDVFDFFNSLFYIEIFIPITVLFILIDLKYLLFKTVIMCFIRGIIYILTLQKYHKNIRKKMKNTTFFRSIFYFILSVLILVCDILSIFALYFYFSAYKNSVSLPTEGAAFFLLALFSISIMFIIRMEIKYDYLSPVKEVAVIYAQNGAIKEDINIKYEDLYVTKNIVSFYLPSEDITKVIQTKDLIRFEYKYDDKKNVEKCDN